MKSPRFRLLVAALVVVSTPLLAQQPDSIRRRADTTAAAAKPAPVITPAPPMMEPPIVIQHVRPADQRGINMFEPPKADDTVTFKGFRIDFGAAFTQQFQGLDHSNTADPNVVSNVNRNKLMRIGHGFNNAVANLYLNAQLAPGIRVAMTSYLSARHHQETWVKDGYLLIDGSPIDNPLLKTVMKYTTVRFGHFELNYGDAHFRRTDNGNAMYNPFVGNLLMDAFTTEVGGEVYLRKGPWLAMVGGANGESRGQITVPQNRSVAWFGKAGFDTQLTGDFRVRLTGSVFQHARANSGTLYSGDRAGGRYYLVMVNTAGTEKDSAWTGNVQPGFKNEERAWVVNPFVKYRGLEFFGNIEQSRGRAFTETAKREWSQYAGELVYRLFSDRVYAGTRYNVVKGPLPNTTNDVSVDRMQYGAGWFVTPTLLLKGEYMTQNYRDFLKTDIRNGGKVRGFVLEGVVAF